MTESRERAVAFVVARLSSSRLPAKQLRHIGPKSILDWIMDALADCEELDEIVLTTVAEDENRPLRDLAESRGWPCFWYEGEVDDVVGRLTAAARRYDAEICLLISADCPLVHGPSVDRMIAALRAEPTADYVRVMPSADGSRSLNEGVQVARWAAWERADAMSDRPELREHQFPVISRSPERFQRCSILLQQSIYGDPHRLSIDTDADLAFMRTLYDRLAQGGLPFSLPQAVSLLERDPSLKSLNRHVHQRAVGETLRRVIFAVDAGGEYGFGHLMRCIELAQQIVERLGWPVVFLLDEPTSRGLAEEAGFRVTSGALGRPLRNVDGVAPEALSDNRFDLAFVDLSVRRALRPGWRRAFFPDSRVVVIDRADAMAAEADLVVHPGVSGRPGTASVKLPPVIEGLECVILRREIMPLTLRRPDKNLDLLVYLYDEEHRMVIDELAKRLGWDCEQIVGFAADFSERLARARVFISGYGQSFYEAVAVGTLPIAWPLSKDHALDASAFYAALGIAPLVVADREGVSEVLDRLSRDGLPTLPHLDDGTPAIVRCVKQLFSPSRPAPIKSAEKRA